MGATQRAAERNLKEALATRASRTTYAEVTPDSSFTKLVELWLDDLDLEGKVAESTRALYERNMRQLVMPVVENYTLREITTGRVDRFLNGDGEDEELQPGEASQGRARSGGAVRRVARESSS